MGEDKGDQGSDFAEKMREFELKNPDVAKWLLREESFFTAVADALREHELWFRAFYGGHVDELGGELFYIYVRPPEDKPIRLGKGFRKKDIPEVGEVLPEALAAYFDGISEAMSKALDSLLKDILQSSLGRWRPLDRWPEIRPLSFFDIPEVNIEYNSESGKAEITRFPRVKHGGHKKPKLSAEELAKLPTRLAEIEDHCRPIKEQHDKQKSAYENSPRVQRIGFKQEEWIRVWVSYAQQLYDLSSEFLAQFADLGVTVSSIAYKELARQTGYKVSYLEKQVTKARKAKKR
jgi:hypothetical protein